MTDPSPLRSPAPIAGTRVDPAIGDSPRARRRAAADRRLGALAVGQRRLAALAVAGVVGAVASPALLAAPAAAAPAPAVPCRENFGATAAADLLTLELLDLGPLRVPLPTVADLKVSSTRSGVAGDGGPRSAALATYLRARLLGTDVPAGVLAAKAEQQAPPSNPKPTEVPTVGVDLGALRLGTGGLSAHATLVDRDSCEATTGPASRSTAKLAQANLLAPPRKPGLARIDTIATDTTAHLTRDGNRYAATAAAKASVAELTLFGGTAAAVKVKVISQPTLTATAGGSRERSSVAYSAPILEVTLPGGAGVRRLDGKLGHLDLAVPVDAASAGSAADLARTEGLPLLGGNPLDDLLGALGRPAGAASAGASAEVEASGAGSAEPGPGGPELGAIPALPDLGETVDRVTGGLLGSNAKATGNGQATAGPGAGPGAGAGTGRNAAEKANGKRASERRQDAKVLILRLSIGELTKDISNAGVRAKATSVRLELLLRSCGQDGYGGADDRAATIADLGIGVLDVAAAAPTGGGPGGGGPGGGTGTGTGGESGNGGGQPGGNPGGSSGGSAGTPGGGVGNAGSLPVTGNRLALVAGAGTLMLLGGRLLMLLARRRAAASATL